MALNDKSLATPGDTDFPVDWPNPEDAELTWTWNAEHYPFPFTPLSVDLNARAIDSLADARGLGKHRSLRGIFPNGYCYLRGIIADMGVEPDPEIEERQRRIVENLPRIREIWVNEYKPQIISLVNGLKNPDYSAMSVSELASQLEEHLVNAGMIWVLTMLQAEYLMLGRGLSLTFFKDEFDAEGDYIYSALTEGFVNETGLSQIKLWKLARLVSTLPEVEGVFRTNSPDSLIDIVSTTKGGDAFLEEFEAYLDKYGWRSDMWFELSSPTWREEPRRALQIIQEYLANPQLNPERMLARNASRRRRLTRKVHSQIGDDPHKQEKFAEALHFIRHDVSIKEDRALWQLALSGLLRVPSLALGAKLKTAGALQEADDIFYLHLTEIQQIGTDLHSVDAKHLVAARKSERDKWMQVVPPLTIGAPPNGSGVTRPNASLDSDGSQNVDERILRGLAASRGIAQGRARVIHTLEESNKLERGDILVCRATSPAWTALVARAAAVVSETGGPLAHTAIVTREFGIPSVVSAEKAMQRIQDGMVITVDGGQGIVRLEG